MKKMIASVLAVSVMTACSAVTAAADTIEVDSFVKPGIWYEFEMTSDSTSKMFGIDFTHKTDFSYEIRNNYDTEAVGNLTVTIDDGDSVTSEVYAGKDCYVAPKAYNYKKYASSILKKVKLSDSVFAKLDTYEEYISPDNRSGYSTFNQMQVNGFVKQMDKKLYPKPAGKSLKVRGNDRLLITLKGDTKGDTFRIRFNCEEDAILNTDHYYPATGALLLKKGSTLDLYKKGAKYFASDATIASINSKGQVRANKTGRTTVTVKTKSKAYTYDLLIYDLIKPVKSYTNDTLPKLHYFHHAVPINMKVGDALDVALLDIFEECTVHSTDTKIASITSKGQITAKKRGTATITVKIDYCTWKYKINIR